jgi:3-oxoacyl-[acyl-carrier protein] reductase
MNFDFAGQTVVVTGAAHGFGRAIALAFCRARRKGLGVRPEHRGLAETEAKAQALAGSLHTRTADVSDKDAVAALVQEAASEQWSRRGSGQ